VVDLRYVSFSRCGYKWKITFVTDTRNIHFLCIFVITHELQQLCARNLICNGFKCPFKCYMEQFYMHHRAPTQGSYTVWRRPTASVDQDHWLTVTSCGLLYWYQGSRRPYCFNRLHAQRSGLHLTLWSLDTSEEFIMNKTNSMLFNRKSMDYKKGSNFKLPAV
jgi:hypothetical protein